MTNPLTDPIGPIYSDLTDLNSNKTADRIGAVLALGLRLRRDPLHRDRWTTAWGSKTNAGLARIVARVMSGDIRTAL